MTHFLLAACSGGKFSGPAFPHSIYEGLPCDPSGTVSPNSLNDILVVVANIIQLLLSFAGIIAVITIITGALFMVISQGNPARIKQAREIMTNAIVGLVIVALAYGIVGFVSGTFLG